jgi:hypothetical protein
LFFYRDLFKFSPVGQGTANGDTVIQVYKVSLGVEGRRLLARDKDATFCLFRSI